MEEFSGKQSERLLKQYIHRYLCPRQQYLVMRAFGLHDGHPVSIGAINHNKVECTPSRMVSLYSDALSTLRRVISNDGLTLDDFI